MATTTGVRILDILNQSFGLVGCQFPMNLKDDSGRDSRQLVVIGNRLSYVGLDLGFKLLDHSVAFASRIFQVLPV